MTVNSVSNRIHFIILIKYSNYEKVLVIRVFKKSE